MTYQDSSEPGDNKGGSRWWSLVERLAIEAPITLIALYLTLSIVGDIKDEIRAIRVSLNSILTEIQRR